MPVAAIDLPPLREVIAAHGLAAKKSLGQNFLLDLNLTRRIARAAGPQGAVIYEVGPGPGGLTRALLAEGAAQGDRGGARRALHCRARGNRRRPIRGGWKSIAADALEIDEATLLRGAKGRCASPPICPTTSAPRS